MNEEGRPAGTGGAGRRVPLVMVAVGTDHHPFDRLVRWVERWLGSREPGSVRCFVQSGTAEPPRGAEWAALVPHDRLGALLDEAHVIVTHGGPGTIMEARRRGATPIVVPRRPDLGEHVDDHQVRFARRIAEDGRIVLAETEERFRRALDAALASPRTAAPAGDPEPSAGVSGFASEVAPLLRSAGPPTPDARDPIRVLYIGGWGRSGSTLLDRLLGQVPGFLSIGEMREGWLRGCIEDRLCGCRRPFRACDFWSRVGDRAFGGWDRAAPRELQRLRRRYDRPWTVPLLAAAGRAPRPEGLDVYVQALARLYAAIRDVSGCEVIVDSSKLPSYALLLRSVPDLDLRVLHLVRDPRGVAYSWQKRVRRTDAPGRDDFMLRFGPLGASVRYDVYNGQTQLLRWLGLPYRRMRYEDLVADPARRLAEVLAFAGVRIDPGSLGFLEDGVARLTPGHTVDGNPMRLTRGRLTIRADDAWTRDMSPRDRRLVTGVAAPLLLLYGYPLRPW